MLRFAERILTAENADCVDVYRASGDVIRSVISCTREGADPSLRDTVLNITTRYPSLEPTLRITRRWRSTTWTTMPRRRRGRAHARLGVRELADDAPRRRRRARRSPDPLRRRRARLERRAGVPHQRVPARRRRLRQHGAPGGGRGQGPVPRRADRARRRPRLRGSSDGHRRTRRGTSAKRRGVHRLRHLVAGRETSAVSPASTATAWTRACAAGSSKPTTTRPHAGRSRIARSS